MTEIIGVNDNSGMTEWNQLKARCNEHGAKLVLRVETFDDDFRLSLAAKDRQGKLVNDLRRNAGEHAPQYVITSLVNDALENWWHG